MATNNPVVIAGKLDSKELEKSIDELVNTISGKLSGAAKSFDEQIGSLQTKLTSFSSVINSINNDAAAMATSFDNVAKSLNKATKNSPTFNASSGTQSPDENNKYTVEWLRQMIQEAEEERETMRLGTQELKDQNNTIELRKKLLKDELMTEEQITREKEKQNELERRRQDAATKKAQAPLLKEFERANTMAGNTTDELITKLKRLQNTRTAMKNAGIFDEAQINRVTKAIDAVQKKLDSMRTYTLRDIKRMSEKSVDDITAKMRALKSVQIDPKNTLQVKQLGDEYNRLSNLQAQMLGRTTSLTRSNHALAQSFGYIRNRIIYALTLGTVTSFVKQLYEIRSQYELLERSLGILIGSFRKGSAVFNELNTMALKSPFTLIELSTAAKQLTAYNFAADEVVDTTRRLADLSAALGVPMERLTYNLGQIRAQTVLTARDARDFANAGLPIVKTLADYYSELEGRVVSTGEVFSRMSKRAVSYNDVMTVLNSLTDEGGKFFDFQAKQAETLKVQLANLNLAWNNMLNSIGKTNQNLLSAPLKGLRLMLTNWQELVHIIEESIAAFGMYKVAQMSINAVMGTTARTLRDSILANKAKIASDLERESLTRKLTKSEKTLLANRKLVTAEDYKSILATKNLNKQQAIMLVAFNRSNKELTQAIVKMKLLTKTEVEGITYGKAFNALIQQMALSIKQFARNIVQFLASNWIVMSIAAIVGAISEMVYTWEEIGDKAKQVNQEIVSNVKESAKTIEDFLKSYNETYKKLYEWDEKGGIKMSGGSPVTKDLKQDEAEKAWEAIKEQIELSAAASSLFVDQLMRITDVNDRVRAGFSYLQDIHDVQGALQNLEKDAIEFAGDWSKWWNLWSLPDGLIGNYKDYAAILERVHEQLNAIEEAEKDANNSSFSLENAKKSMEMNIDKMQTDYNKFKDDLAVTSQSMITSFAALGINGAEKTREAFTQTWEAYLSQQEMDSKEQVLFRIEAEKSFIEAKKKEFEKEIQFERDRNNEQRAEDLQNEMNAWIARFGAGETAANEFYKWLRNTHSSSVTKMFGNMTKKEIETLEKSKPEWEKWAKENAKAFSDYFGVSFDELWERVKDANKWKIIIPLFIQQDEKTVYDSLVEWDKKADEANQKIERLQTFISELSKKGKKDTEEYTKATDQLKDAQEEYNDALEHGGHSKSKQKAANKERKTEEQELSEALRNELSVIKDMQSNYDKLRKAGVSSTTAINIASQGYGDTLRKINSTLSKYGISKFRAEDYMGKDVNEMLEMLEKQKAELISSGRVKMSSIKDLDVRIQELRVDAKTYNMKKVTEGLNNELSKLKDEYELQVELDATSGLGDALTDLLGIDTSDFPQTFEEYMSKVNQAFDKYRLEMSQWDSPWDVFTMSKQDVQDWGNRMGLDDDTIKNMQKNVEGQKSMYQKYVQDIVKQNNTMEYELGTNADKIAKKEKEIDDLRAKLSNDLTDIEINNINLRIRKEEEELAKLRAELLNSIPAYAALYQSVAEHSENMTRRLTKNMLGILEDAKNNVRDGGLFAIMYGGKEVTRMSQKELDRLIEKITKDAKKVQAPFDKIKEAFTKGDDKVIDFAKGIEYVSQEVKKLSDLVNTIGDVAEAMGLSEEPTEVIRDISKSLDGLSTMQTGISQIMNKDYISGITSLSGGLLNAMSTWFDNGDKKIQRSIKDSEMAVKRLELAYKDIQYAIEDAFGTATVGAEKAALANKTLQLTELKRQLTLQESRAGKNRDEDAIINLKGQIKDLEREIESGYKSIITNLLGISDVGSAVENMVQSVANALRNGENAIDAWNTSIDDMIVNMITRFVSAQVVGPMFQKVIDDMTKTVAQRGATTAQELEEIKKQKDAKQAEVDEWSALYNRTGLNAYNQGATKLQEELDALNKQIVELEDQAKQQTEFTKQDLEYMVEHLAELKANGGDWMSYLQELLGQYGLMGGANEAQLSNLQQGIQGITETTAGALEAYCNNMLTQIYVQVGIQSRMLLELQNSYQIQAAIHAILTGVVNANGMAFRVELMN